MLAGTNAFIAISKAEPGSSRLSAPALNDLGLRHLCFQNRSIDKLSSALKIHGGSLFSEPVDLGTGNQYAYGRDPEGNIYELEGLHYADMHDRPWIGHAAIVVSDLDSAIAFYGELLGSSVRNRLKIGPSRTSDKMSGFRDAVLEGAWLYAGNMLIELWQFINPASEDVELQGAVLANRLVFETTDAAESAKQAVALGASLESAPVERGAWITTNVISPEGAPISFVECRGACADLSFEGLNDPFVCARTDTWDTSEIVTNAQPAPQ
ncbi:MAG: hypothetical protein HRU11_08215 [Parvularculaceae bacterium]|nr:hypothetical protein [Parvularculaceae bacterium]